jgi:hypothetical protein
VAAQCTARVFNMKCIVLLLSRTICENLSFLNPMAA